MPRMTVTEARGLLGWSTERLAKEADTAPANIRDIESGRNANPSHLLVIKIARAIQRGGLNGVSVDDLFPVPEQEVA
jgi:transcriptional regulator with XRE-family HTH domain